MKETTLREKTCFFSGHRDIPREDYPAVQSRLSAAVERLITEEGVQYFASGGALGFDTIAALTVLKLKRRYPQIRLVLIFPCKNQGFSWQEEDKELLEKIMERADKVIYATEKYQSSCVNKRNRLMAEGSGWAICYQTRPTGGTAYTINYAKSIGVNIINLAEQ